jgi:hypothetical protein
MTLDAVPGNGSARRSSSRSEWLRLLYTDRWIMISWFVLLGFGLFSAYALLSLSEASGSALPVRDVCLISAWVAYWGWSMYWGLPGCVWLLYRAWRKLFAAFSIIGFSFAGPLFFISVIALVCYPPFGGGVFHFARRWWLSGKRVLDVEARNLEGPPGHVQPSNPAGGVLPIGVPPNTPQYTQPPPMQPTPFQPNYAQAGQVQPAYVHPGYIQPAYVQPVYVQQNAQWAEPPESPRGFAGVDGGTKSEPMPEIEQQLRTLEQLRERAVISQEEHDRQRSAILDRIREPVSLSWDGRKRTLPKHVRAAYRATLARGSRGSGVSPGDELGILEEDPASALRDGQLRSDLTGDEHHYLEELDDPRHSGRRENPDRDNS